MLTDDLIEIYERDIRRLREEISLYKDDAHLWRTSGEIKNSAGTIALHLVGNLKYWIGNVIGGNKFVRDRDSEFTIRNIPRADILKMIDETAADVTKALTLLREKDLANEFPSDVLEKRVTAHHYLIYLISHLNYHAGQINYHRRLTG